MLQFEQTAATAQARQCRDSGRMDTPEGLAQFVISPWKDNLRVGCEMKSSVFAVCVFVSLQATASQPNAFEVEVGQRRTFTIGRSQGFAIQSADVAEAELHGTSQIQVLGSSPGTTVIDVWTKAGAVVHYTLTVKPGRTAQPSSAVLPNAAWSQARLGGARIPSADCGLDLADRDADQALKKARLLLVDRDVGPALAQLDKAIRLSPVAMVPRIFKGAALDRSERSAGAMAEYETFVLSCANHPLTPPLVGVLRDYVERTSPEPEAKAVKSKSAKMARRHRQKVKAWLAMNR